MSPVPELGPLLAPGRVLARCAGGVASDLPPGARAAPYDRRAAIYDRLISGALYNRVAWGAAPAAYRRFAAEAVASGSGPFLDAGCGTAVFTHRVYADSRRPLVLADISLGMLAQARRRVHGDHAAFVQADLLDLPFADRVFATVASFGVLHLLDDLAAALAELRRVLACGGTIFLSALVTDRGLSRRYMRLLERHGELAHPRSAAELEAASRKLFSDVRVARTGAMARVTARR